MNARYPQIYPAYCFNASPTYNTWVKVTAADVHGLRVESGFEGQNIYFHLNHPIRYVRLVGPIVAIQEIASKWIVLTLDDGSGATIEVQVARLSDDDGANFIDFNSNTTVQNLNVTRNFGLTKITIDSCLVDIGSVVKVKCTISEFRRVKRLDLKRVTLLNTTDEEATAWSELVNFRKNVLSKPWMLSTPELKKIEKGLEKERRKEKEIQKKKAEYEQAKLAKKQKYAESLKRYEEKQERVRRKEEIIMNFGALI
ncbi:hypothetical protein M501DRAFT_1013239 [Patellaria atrata CBS 101060]|uniref:CST complex subunit Stn1 N-terminal domain-containing protein n=1 Tax=Patellaria atrata CBS 101060 TaxID=1346257 RepID=A0A9P4SFR7_9PEZI|nr:hypothetical protein M501DRAFT_1013239 [Patellaria atrata CBS 101060]